MKFFNLIIYLVIALCLALLLGFTKDLSEEILDLQAMDTLHSQEIAALRDRIELCDERNQWVIAEVREIVEPFSHIIPIDGGFLGLREDTN